jgi:molybdopterin converting factor small subunit
MRRNIDRAVTVEVRIRLGTGLARLAPAPRLTLELPDGATVEELYKRLGASNPELAPALGSALPVIQGAHVDRGQILSQGDEVALLTPLSGG